MAFLHASDPKVALRLDYYVHEVDGTRVDDYAILSHSGHGVNSYTIQ